MVRCKHCGFEFSSAYGRPRHSEACAKRTPAERRAWIEARADNPDTCCKYCGFGFEDLRGFAAHTKACAKLTPAERRAWIKDVAKRRGYRSRRDRKRSVRSVRYSPLLKTKLTAVRGSREAPDRSPASSTTKARFGLGTPEGVEAPQENLDVQVAKMRAGLQFVLDLLTLSVKQLSAVLGGR